MKLQNLKSNLLTAMEIFTQNQNKLSLVERATAPTPPLFAWIRNIGVILAALAGAVITMQEQGVQLPEIVTVVADRVVVVSGIIAAIVSQLTVDFSKLAQEKIFSKVAEATKKKPQLGS